MKKLKLTQLYKCFADLQRLRILNVLQDGPLCVCHLQEVLDETQVKVSKHLQYMRHLGLVEARREGKWMYYSLVQPPHPLLRANMQGFAAFREEYEVFQNDNLRRDAILERLKGQSLDCSGSESLDAAEQTTLLETTPIP